MSFSYQIFTFLVKIFDSKWKNHIKIPHTSPESIQFITFTGKFIKTGLKSLFVAFIIQYQLLPTHATLFHIVFNIWLFAHYLSLMSNKLCILILLCMHTKYTRLLLMKYFITERVDDADQKWNKWNVYRMYYIANIK